MAEMLWSMMKVQVHFNVRIMSSSSNIKMIETEINCVKRGSGSNVVGFVSFCQEMEFKLREIIEQDEAIESNRLIRALLNIKMNETF